MVWPTTIGLSNQTPHPIQRLWSSQSQMLTVFPYAEEQNSPSYISQIWTATNPTIWFTSFSFQNMTHFHLRLVLPIFLLLLLTSTTATTAVAAFQPRIPMRKQVIFRPSSPSVHKYTGFEEQKRRVPTGSNPLHNKRWLLFHKAYEIKSINFFSSKFTHFIFYFSSPR